MKKGTVILIAVLVVVAVLLFGGIGSYNKLVKSQTEVEKAASDIDAVLQRRADLIPNLVNTVKGFAAHETEVFNAVNEARAALVGAGTMEEKAEASEELSASLNRLIAIAEAYPELKSDTAYVGLMDELAGTENRISVARQAYNESAASYNKLLKAFPTVIFARMLNFQPVGYFEAAPESASAPVVDFGQ